MKNLRRRRVSGERVGDMSVSVKSRPPNGIESFYKEFLSIETGREQTICDIEEVESIVETTELK